MIEKANEGTRLEELSEAYDHCLTAEGKLRTAWIALMDVSEKSENPVYCFDPSRTTEENNLETLWGVVKVIESCISDLQALERAIDTCASGSPEAEG